MSEMMTEEGIEVRLPSGSMTKVLTEDEAFYITDKAARYLEQNHFVADGGHSNANISDLQDIDQMLRLEMLCWRIGIFLGRGGLDYNDRPIDEPNARKTLREYSAELRQVKKSLGIDKLHREAELGEASIAGYLGKLRQRALEFGIHRDRQNAKILELGMQLIALNTYRKNTTPDEQKEYGISAEDLLTWIDEVFTVELMALDAHFRINQRAWIQDM